MTTAVRLWPAEIAEKLCALGFVGDEPNGWPRVTVSLITGEVERVELAGEIADPGHARVAEALTAAAALVAAAPPPRPRPSLMDALILRLSGRGLGAELASDVEAVLARAAAEAVARLDVAAVGPAKVADAAALDVPLS